MRPQETFSDGAVDSAGQCKESVNCKAELSVDQSIGLIAVRAGASRNQKTGKLENRKTGNGRM